MEDKKAFINSLVIMGNRENHPCICGLNYHCDNSTQLKSDDKERLQEEMENLQDALKDMKSEVIFTYNSKYFNFRIIFLAIFRVVFL